MSYPPDNHPTPPHHGIPLLTPREQEIYRLGSAAPRRPLSPLRLPGHNCVELVKAMIALAARDKLEELEGKAMEAMREVRDHRTEQWLRTGQWDEDGAREGMKKVVGRFQGGMRGFYNRMQHLHGPTHPHLVWEDMNLYGRLPKAYHKIKPAGSSGPLRWDLLDSKAELLDLGRLGELQYSEGELEEESALEDSAEEGSAVEEEERGEPSEGNEEKNEEEEEGKDKPLDAKEDSEDGEEQLAEKSWEGSGELVEVKEEEVEKDKLDGKEDSEFQEVTQDSGEQLPEESGEDSDSGLQIVLPLRLRHGR
ncbi:uncharacterized protein C8A04DRAFT_26559 [Dichotomopilus funicola]|uniref:Uncharacterized protein n=1 Tax=Dichotomopilus funicola TaxID=1934379 RepID=A0AAN6V8M0_9PEZI|nr:hypothetical protein C8A04DRAFT_26559 [Dichotomopilus funicola]